MPRAPRAKRAPDVILVALTELAQHGIAGAEPAAVAAAAGVDVARVIAEIGGRDGVLPALNRKVDAVVAAAGPADTGAPPRERLFDILMRRFDALAPYRVPLAALAGKPGLAVCLAPSAAAPLVDSMAAMLALAGLDRPGLVGRARAAALAGVWIGLARHWYADDSPDLTRTMAAVDRVLGRVESWL